MLQLITFFQSRLVRDERGATAVEYGLMVSLIAIVIIVAVAAIGTALNVTFNEVATTL
jgi:pilus assembly protein Flp/PilA